ncbi:hypothetical protein GCM10020000_78320 [Streptomyces olivoverticillatus]
MDLPAHWLDLRNDAARRRWDGPAKARVISGVYDPSRDAAEHMAVASLADAFDVLVHIRQVSPPCAGCPERRRPFLSGRWLPRACPMGQCGPRGVWRGASQGGA